MLVVRKEDKAHDRYNSFRSSFEILEAVGRQPHDWFKDTEGDLSPLQKLKQKMEKKMNEKLEKMKELMEQRMEQIQQQIDDLRSENELLRSNTQVDNNILK